MGFVQENSAFLLSSMTLCVGCIAMILKYMRVSRCQTVDCLCIKCIRDVVPSDVAMDVEIAPARA